MAADEDITVELAWSPEAGDVRLVSLRVAPGTTLGEAVALVGWIGSGEPFDAGVFGRRQPADYRLKPLDRVEIYRPLVVDPKEARRRRVAARKAGTQG